MQTPLRAVLVTALLPPFASMASGDSFEKGCAMFRASSRLVEEGWVEHVKYLEEELDAVRDKLAALEDQVEDELSSFPALRKLVQVLTARITELELHAGGASSSSSSSTPTADVKAEKEAAKAAAAAAAAEKEAAAKKRKRQERKRQEQEIRDHYAAQAELALSNMEDVKVARKEVARKEVACVCVLCACH
jgi:predicted ribosome quality control (RQC) complex YloA/Tae2 family protein